MNVIQQQAPLIELVDVHKSFGATEVLKGVSMSIRRGETACIIGPSGSGKSTLLRCLNGLIGVDRGTIRVGSFNVEKMRRDRDLVPLRHEVSMVFQQYNLFPHRTVMENIVMAPVQVLGQPRDEVKKRAAELLARVRLTGKENAYPAQLSGGQQQRVAIARALAMQPAVILFDEVTAALDPEMVSEVLAVIRDLSRDGMTCVLVTHEMRFAEEVADLVFFTDRGTIVESGAPAELFHAPRDPRLASFLGKVLSRTAA
ncbi:peptide ABC transporter ATP-binding protein [Burkholderia sp. Leaf177]|uniref:amino acid ABC transporter ATP-binding protein n=1 Tax=Burkholderia sp. Leaf177 TaxID=1736287 RepID=UPI0006F94008|nr:amino acid ABC transporter ATP-binding protein [Burkholderia sp. Leaf177]KQR81780.1 peptide ABC transporter ATP-binding protein [Burkholderia sp. Leaf177]